MSSRPIPVYPVFLKYPVSLQPLSVMGGKNAGTLEMGRRRYYKLAVPLCRAGRRNPLLLQCKSSRPWCHLSMLCGSWRGTSILKLQLKSTGNAARISAFSMISLDLSRWTKRLGRRLCCTPGKTSLLFYESLSCTRPLLSAAETKRYWGSTFRFKLV